jgi:hypothetical protein
LRFALFLATGLAVPFFAFPPFRVLGRSVDLATVFAALFVLTMLPVLPGRKMKSRRIEAWLAAAVLVPLVCLVPPLPKRFLLGGFLFSYGHWVLMVVFFVCAGSLALSAHDRARLAAGQLVVALPVALFGLYQLIGRVRRWPLTGRVLVGFQREPFAVGAAGSFRRPNSIFLEPAWFGGYLIFVFLLAAALGLAVRSRRSRAALGAALCVLALGALATISWGAWIDLAVASTVALAVAIRARLLPPARVARVLAFAFLLLIAALATPPGRRTLGAVVLRARLAINGGPLQPRSDPRLEKVPGDSTTSRYKEARFEVRMIAARPLRGVGLGQVSQYIRDPRHHKRLHASCGWLAVAVEAGLLGPLLLLGALGLVWTRWREGEARNWTHVAVPALVVFAAFEQIHTSSFIDLWWWYPVAVAMVFTAGPRQGQAGRVPPSGLAPAADAS